MKLDPVNLFPLIGAVTLLILGALTLIRNYRLVTNVLFSVMSWTLMIWILSNFFAESDIHNSLFWSRLAFASISIAVGAFLCFVIIFPDRLALKRGLSLLLIGVLFLSVSVCAISFSPHFIPRVDIHNGASNVVTGSLYFVFIVYFVLMFMAGLIILGAKSFHGDIQNKARARLIFLGIFLMGFSSSLTNLLLPALSGTNEYASIGTSSSIIFVGFMYYAIAKHKLFNLRLVVARSLAYILTLLGLLILYLLASYYVVYLFSGHAGLNSKQLLAYSLVSLLVALLFQPTKNFFDKVTSRIFFRNAYDTQQKLDQLSEIAVEKYEIDDLVNQSLTILGEAVRPQTSELVLLDAKGEYYDDFSVGKRPRVQPAKIIEALSKQKEPLLSTDDFDRAYDLYKDIVSFLNNHDITISVRLNTLDETVGYLLFGPKLSGDIYSEQDLTLIGIAANELSVAIQNARRFDEIQRFNQTLKLEIDRATAELRKSNEKLQALDEAKDEFITMASHQLRTPLTSIKGYVSMVMEEDAGKITDKQRELLGNAFSSSQRMVYLISDLLNVSRLKTGKFIIEPSEVYLPDMAENEIHQLVETAKRKDITINYKKPKKFPTVMLDDNKTRQVMMNFIDNAIYYTPQGGKINVALKAGSKSVEFTVTDNGIGVPKFEQHKLFTKFYRAGNARKARPDGTGLGLFMAKKVVVAQGGALIFKSKENKGSTFGFNYPLKKIAATKKSKKQ